MIVSFEWNLIKSRRKVIRTFSCLNCKTFPFSASWWGAFQLFPPTWETPSTLHRYYFHFIQFFWKKSIQDVVDFATSSIIDNDRSCWSTWASMMHEKSKISNIGYLLIIWINICGGFLFTLTILCSWTFRWLKANKSKTKGRVGRVSRWPRCAWWKFGG